MEYALEPRTRKKISPGTPDPLGATLRKDGVNFAVFSQYAQKVFLLLFDTPAGEPTNIIAFAHRTGHIWHSFVHGIKAGQLYGYKVRGAYNPAQGMRFNEHKLLIDPYAKALTGKCSNCGTLLFSHDTSAPDKDLVMDTRDSARVAPKSIVIDDSFDWRGDNPPSIPWEDLIIYEVHLRGFTAHKSSRVRRRGTYAGFIKKIPYLKALGVNAVELLPVHESHPQDFLVDRGLVDYWGYNTIGFFAPESWYRTGRHSGCQVNEFKRLVRELHKARIEVILDVVYNHTGEGNELGPTVCFRGIDNPTYYALNGPPEQPYRYYKNDTGCGNTLNVENPQVLRLVIDSLRYWVEVMHVDGFRFDLASILARVQGAFSKEAAFFDIISRDPVLQKVKMIAEPWDLTTYQVGNFPANWSEWNGKFRDTLRRFLRGDEGQIRDLGWRITGSSDLYGDGSRFPYNSINFITCHDGFTLRDLFSYNEKHNEENGEYNKDGTLDNFSWNCGAEGEVDDPDIMSRRKQMVKNALCCLFFSLGTPMLLAGDEDMRTQQGNNNAYCQDNEISWFDWKHVNKHADVLEFCKKAIAFRKRYTILRRRKFFAGKDTDADNVPDIAWFGKNLERPRWDDPRVKLLCYQLDGSEAPSELGNYHLFFILNPDGHQHSVRLPRHENMNWYRVIDTALKTGQDFLVPGKERIVSHQDSYRAKARSTVVLLGKQQ